MRKIAAKHSEVLVLRQKGENFYFGFENGLSIRFSTSEKLNHVNRISVGHHIG